MAENRGPVDYRWGSAPWVRKDRAEKPRKHHSEAIGFNGGVHRNFGGRLLGESHEGVRSSQKSSPGRPPLGRGSSPPQHGLIMRERPPRRYAAGLETAPKTVKTKRIFQPVAAMRQFWRWHPRRWAVVLHLGRREWGDRNREAREYLSTAAA